MWDEKKPKQNKDMPMKYVCVHEAYLVVVVCLFSENEIQKTFDNILLLVSVSVNYALFIPCLCVQVRASKPRLIPTTVLLLAFGEETKMA